MQSPPSDVCVCFCKSCFHLVTSCQWNRYRAGVLSERSQAERQIHQERRAFPASSVVKNSPAMQEAQVQSLVQEHPLEKEMATRSSILVWEIR